MNFEFIVSTIPPQRHIQFLCNTEKHSAFLFFVMLIELKRISTMVRMTGIEPAASCSQSKHSTKLSYIRIWCSELDSNPESVTGQRFSRLLDYQLSQPCVFRTLIQNRTELTANLLRVYIENYHCMSSKTAIVVILNIRKDVTMKLYNQA